MWNTLRIVYLLSAATATIAHPWARSEKKPDISVIEANSTTRWASGDPNVQVFDIIVKNTGDDVWLSSADRLSISVESKSLKTVQPAHVKRLRPGDSAVVEVGVETEDGVELGSKGDATIVARWSGEQESSLNINATYGIPPYEKTRDSVDKHESADWWRNAKYGIFIHWGLYSVPAWGNSGDNRSYAEWYWSRLPNADDISQTYQYHQENYGEDFLYDDFMTDFTAEKFDPKSWVDLIEDAGARYFVHVTKHHDGYALFDMPETVSKRTSVKQAPHRDFLKELFDAAKEYQPQLRRGTYFSLPEWYNPAYTKYGDGEDWGTGPPKNVYTGETVPYVGFVEVDDFLSGIQLPQMETLVYDYDTEIMWCDIGRDSLAVEFAAKWLNDARQNSRQVLLNDRCGTVSGDFETPEYEEETSLSPRHWEATRGLDPYSFGYNAATPDEDYMNTTTVITTLVDIVSKNGNFLLDMGPKADGTIPEIMEKVLRESGKWIKAHAESIFDTTYWPSGPGEGDFRYTTTADAFYIHVLTKPSGSLVIPDPIPYMSQDSVTVVGGSKHGTTVQAKLKDDKLVLGITDDIASADKHTWTFKIEY